MILTNFCFNKFPLKQHSYIDFIPYQNKQGKKYDSVWSIRVDRKEVMRVTSIHAAQDICSQIARDQLVGINYKVDLEILCIQLRQWGYRRRKVLNG